MTYVLRKSQGPWSSGTMIEILGELPKEVDQPVILKVRRVGHFSDDIFEIPIDDLTKLREKKPKPKETE